MKKKYFKSRFYPAIAAFISIAGFFSSCDKEPLTDSTKPSAIAAERQGDILDRAYFYTKDIYLWEELLPGYTEFNPRGQKDIYSLMGKVRSYQPLDRFSFVETKAETEETGQGLDTDFGFLVKFFTDQFDLRVNYVYADSPGGKAGVKRGWKILKVNGNSIDGASQSDIDLLNKSFFGEVQLAEFEFQKPDQSKITLTLTKSTYTLNTVLHKSIIKCGSKKAGYFVFNEFSGATSVTELVKTIRYLESNGVEELIIDLRYNRGGFVSTQDTLANMIAPKSVGRGQNVMYQYVFNSNYSFFNKETLFYKTGSLNFRRIIFIVSPSSASASELLINNLNPVMDVVLIGEERTYGKPVGFFPIPVGEYNIYPVSFKTVNSVGYADYYEGFKVDKNTIDDLAHAFGDVQEACLKEALHYITTGSFTGGQERRAQTANQFGVNSMNEKINANILKVKIEDRQKKMPKPVADMIRAHKPDMN